MKDPKAALAPIKKAIADVFNWGPIQDFFKSISGAFHDFASSPLWAAIKSAVGGVVAGVVSFVKELNKLGVFKAALKVLGDGFRIVGDVIKTIVDLLSGRWGKLGGDISKLGHDILDVFRNLGGMVTGILRAFGAVVLSTLRSVFTAAWASITGVFTQALNSIRSVLSSAWTTISSTAKAAWNSIRLVFSTVWVAITGVFTQALSTVRSALSAAWTTISATAQKAWNTIKSFFTSWWNSEVASFTTAVNTIRSALSSAWNVISSTAQSVWNGIRSFFTSWWAGIVSLFTSDVNTIRSALSAAWTAISSTAQSVWNGIRNFFTSWWAGIVSTFTSDVNTIRSVLSTAWDAIDSTAKSVFNGILTFFGGFWTALKNGFSAAVTAIGQTWGKLENIVKVPVNLVLQHVIDPLFGAIDDVTSFVGLGRPLKPVKPLAEGGKVTGGTPGKDSVLGVLMPGEVVIPTKLVDAGAVDHLRGMLPGFGSGGMVLPRYGAGGIAADLGTGIGPSEAQMVDWFGGIGDPSHEANVNFAGRNIQVNKLVAGTVGQIGSAVGSAYPGYVDSSTGGFRTSIGASTSHIPYSMHQLGLAIDVNPDTNPYLGNSGSILQHRKIIDIFKQHGWFWGGNWGPGGRDQMHFQLENTKGQAAGGGSGILGFLGGVVRSIEDIFSGLAGPAGKAAIDLAHGDTAGAARALLGNKKDAGGASGQFAKMLLQLPVTLAGDVVKFLVGKVKSFVTGQQADGGGGGGVSPGGSAGPGAKAAQAWMKAHMSNFGWNTSSDFDALVTLWNGESNWYVTRE